MAKSRFARQAQGLSLEIFPIERPFSNFDFIRQRFPQVHTLRRIMSQVRQLGGRTMALEKLPESGDLREENDDIRTRDPAFRKSECWRLSFFWKRFRSERGLASARSDEFVGYAIIKDDEIPSKGRKVRIYESVLRPSRYPNNCIRGMQEWTCTVGGNQLSIGGYLYAQQNDFTNVCAHVALRAAAARFHPDGDMSYRQMNTIAGVDHRTRTVGDGMGLDTAEMLAILQAAGASCFPADYTVPPAQRPDVPFQKLIYGSIESGYPSIAVFATARGGGNHAIPIFGHTFNEDTWVPCAEMSYFRIGRDVAYIPSESWVSMYIAHDDNWGSNYCVPRGYLHLQMVCDRLPGGPTPCPLDPESVAFVVGTFPSNVRTGPVQAEVIGADYLFKMRPQMPKGAGVWAERLRLYADNNLLVLRPILLDGRDYVEHLSMVRDWSRRRVRARLVDALGGILTGKLWMVELSVPELFSANKRKVGEVLLRADVSPGRSRDLSSFVLARLPDYFALYSGGGPQTPRYQFLPSGASGHVELFGCEDTAAT